MVIWGAFGVVLILFVFALCSADIAGRWQDATSELKAAIYLAAGLLLSGNLLGVAYVVEKLG